MELKRWKAPSKRCGTNPKTKNLQLPVNRSKEAKPTKVATKQFLSKRLGVVILTATVTG